MQAAKKRYKFGVGVILMALGGSSAAVRAAETCVTNGSGPDICVDFDLGTPVLNTHFSVDYSTPAEPEVNIKSGASWNVRSDDSGSPGNIGAIKLHPDATLSDDFEVTIFDELGGSDAGAVDVGDIDLVNVGASTLTGFSSILGGKITGDFTGDLDVTDDSGGDGGEVDLTVGGNVEGTWNIVDVVVSSIQFHDELVVEGDLSGSINVDENINNATIRVDGDVTTTGALTLDSLGIYGIVMLGSDDADDMEGTVTLTNGISHSLGKLMVNGTFTSNGTIDFNEADLDGQLILVEGGEGDIVDIGGINVLKLGTAVGSSYSGDVNADNIIYSGEVTTKGDFGGTISLSGGLGSGFAYVDIGEDMASSAQISVGGSIPSTSYIKVQGDMQKLGTAGADISVTGSVSGSVLIDGDMEGYTEVSVDDLSGKIQVGSGNPIVGEMGGTVVVGGDFSSTGLITMGSVGGRGLVQLDADCSGDIKSAGTMAGDIDIANDVESGGSIDIDASLTGDIDIGGDLKNGGLIDIEESMNGEIVIGGLCDDSITVGRGSSINSLIEAVDGLGDDGYITINDSEGNYDAFGDFFFGAQTAWPPTNDVEFLGCLHVKDNGSGGYGDLVSSASIDIYGCHGASPPDIAICVEGDTDGTITITQDSCSNQVALGGCSDGNCDTP